jgi:hypothetical protein
MTNQTKIRLGHIFLWVEFAAYFFIYSITTKNFFTFTAIWGSALAIYLLIKLKLPSVKYIVISAIFGIAVSLCYLAFQMNIMVVVHQGLLVGLPTLLCSLAVFSVMEKLGSEKSKPYYLLRASGNRPLYQDILISLAIAVGSALILAVINYFLANSNSTKDFAITWQRLTICLSPAIFEEMACRAVFMAFCLYLFRKPTKLQLFTMWFMMIVPHTLSHHYNLILSLILCVLFGLPFAILQRKRDLTSAMISHGLVDAVRFCIFGF